MLRFPALTGFVFVAALFLSSSVTPANAAARMWSHVTPAAGIPIRSAANFRAVATGNAAVSVDIMQINADGTSTRLDSLAASPTGTASAGTYTTQNMAAIYWRYTALPASAGPVSPPPASVTFINDVPAVALTALYYTALPQIPFAPGDASLLLNLDLRNGVPPGWTNSGTGVFDSTNGYTPGTGLSSGLANTAVGGFSSAAQMPQGSIAVRFQRMGVSTDNSFGSSFWDSTGNTLNATTQSRQLFQMRSNSGRSTMQALVAAGTIPALQIKAQTNSMSSSIYYYWQTVNSHYVAGLQDPGFADLLFTWYQNQYYVFFDGHLINAGVLGDVPTYQMFQNICIGNANTAGTPSGSPFGAYSIQQLQISSRFLGPVLAGPIVGLLPDSFAAAYTQRMNPTATGSGGNYQIADIDAVQTALGLYSAMAAHTYNPGQTAPFHQIQALMFQRYGFYPPIYNAGQPGHGYSSINAPIDDAFIAALNRAAPAVVMAGGTVNDINPSKPSDANLIGDTEAIFDRLVQGGGSRIAAPPNPSLEQIIYLETLSSQAVSAGTASGPAIAAESQKIISLTRSDLVGFVPEGSAGFSYITSREWWDEAAGYPAYLYGSAPSNPYNAAGGGDFGNIHPDPTGYSIIAAHLYSAIAGAILTSSGADLSLSGHGNYSAGTASITLSVSNAGPGNAGAAAVTSILPTGVSLISASSSPGCTQSNNTITCLLGALAAGSSLPLTIVLQTGTTPPGSLIFSVGNAGGNDPVSANNSLPISLSSAPLPGGSGDAPLPLWAYALLAMMLTGMATRSGTTIRSRQRRPLK